MAQAVVASSIPASVHEAVAAVVQLINASPHTPRPDEIAAVIARVVHSAPRSEGVTTRTLREFLTYRDLCREWRDLPPELGFGTPDQIKCESQMDDVYRRMHEVTDRVWATPATCWHDVVLRALIYANTCGAIENGVWLDIDLDRFLANDPNGSPHNEQRAIAFMMDALFKVAGVPLPLDVPRGHGDRFPIDMRDHVAALEAFPGAAPQPEPPLHAAIRATIPKVREANYAELNALEALEAQQRTGAHADPHEYQVALERDKKLDAALAKLCEELWATPVAAFDDVLIRAEVAQHFALDWPQPYASDGLTDPACNSLKAFGHLTMAVLTMGGRPFRADGPGWQVEA